ncbi:hypothetical protein RAS1_34120 [Phycisphaerae bacterium RAS1]|nr:hypothetical protein RAS1_34120 [Phycisphaerae bacterium RAS1]
MTWKLNNLTLKAAMSGMMLIGLIVSGLGTVGCDEINPARLAEIYALNAPSAVQDAVATDDDKMDFRSGVIRGSPPRR